MERQMRIITIVSDLTLGVVACRQSESTTLKKRQVVTLLSSDQISIETIRLLDPMGPHNLIVNGEHISGSCIRNDNCTMF